MKATHWVQKNPKKSKPNDDYEKAFELLKITTETMKKNFRTLGKAVVEQDQDTVDSVINYLKENTSREVTDEEIDGLKFIAEFAERGPEEMAHHQDGSHVDRASSVRQLRQQRSRECQYSRRE